MEASVILLEATTPVKLPTKQCPPNKGLDTKQTKGGISTVTPRILANPLQSLPPILHIICPVPILSCSKGAWGLSVPLRVRGIFTATTISPSSWLRQCPDRYTIRAGRNLPDKEFRLRITSPLNLPAPGRCQALYFIFRFRKAMCFC